MPGIADDQLLANHEPSKKGSLGDIVRYAEETGYQGIIPPHDLQQAEASNKGNDRGGTSH